MKKPKRVLAWGIVCEDGAARHSNSAQWDAVSFRRGELSHVHSFPYMCGPHRLVRLREVRPRKKARKV